MLAVALVFAVFSLVIAYAGGAQQGAVGLRSLEFTVTSLVSLVIYLVPLIALLLGFDAIVGERERGSLDLLLAYPITRGELLLGKYLGLSLALALAMLAGLAAVGVMLVYQFGSKALFHYAGFVLSALLMGMSFLSLAVLVSVVARDRTRASGAAIVLWFLFVLVFDLVLLGVLVATAGHYGGDIFPYLLLLNPTDVFRILNVFSTEDVRSAYGLVNMVPPLVSNIGVLTTVMLGWIVVPLEIPTMKKPTMRYRCRCCNPQSAGEAPRHDRRQLMMGLMALAALPMLGACDKEGEKAISVAPVEITQDTACELDGMLLADYPGPKGQIHFADTPEPAFYCDTMEVLNTLMHPEEVRKITAVYVQDMGKADWDHPEGHWIDARTAIYVEGSSRLGSMGPTFGSFSNEEDAKAFIAKYGGKLLHMKDITPEMVDLRGGANMDHSM